MTQKKNTLYILSGIASSFIILSQPTKASQTWNAFCSNASSISTNQTTTSFNANNYIIQAVDNPSVQLTAQQMTATQSNKTLSSDQLQRISNITSTGLLTIILKHQLSNCNKNYYKNTLIPAINSLQKGGNITFSWKDIKIHDQSKLYKAQDISMKITGQGNNLRITLRFSGFTDLKRSNNIFLPQQGQVDATTSAQAYPMILAANSGYINQNDTSNIPVTINNLNISNYMTKITAQGTISLDQNLNISSGTGKINVTNIQRLIDASDKNNVNKLKTALTLAKFAGETINDNTLEWNINLKGNLLKVNNIPIPIW